MPKHHMETHNPTHRPNPPRHPISNKLPPKNLQRIKRHPNKRPHRPNHEHSPNNQNSRVRRNLHRTHPKTQRHTLHSRPKTSHNSKHSNKNKTPKTLKNSLSSSYSCPTPRTYLKTTPTTNPRRHEPRRLHSIHKKPNQQTNPLHIPIQKLKSREPNPFRPYANKNKKIRRIPQYQG
jgi:hypothetical protein